MAYDFPNTPTLGQVYQGWVWDGVAWQVQGAAAQGAVRFDTPQGLNANQQAQARANIDVTQKNYITNGAMMVSQENGTTAGTTGAYYPVDGFLVSGSHGGTNTSQQVAGATPGGSPNRLRVTATVADAAVAAGDYCRIHQPVEGLRAVDLRSGSAAAKTITIQFGVKAPAGTYCVSIRNGATDRSYVAEYVIAAGEANTDVVKSVTIALDTTGTWATDNTANMYVSWALMAGSTTQTAANAWTAGQFTATSNQFNFMGTGGNTFELFDVSLTEGSVAPPFVMPDYASELAACKRYFQKYVGVLVSGYGAAGANQFDSYLIVPSMRATPTGSVTGTAPSYANCSALVVVPYTETAFTARVTVTAAGGYYVDTSASSINLNARL